MSPVRFENKITVERFPRVSGDEPEVTAIEAFTHKFSPRERG